ncbi:interactor of constitutive active rops 3 [Phtheirospermum japonicum]|uniref:Interactor of constitutive active rops 3 n=1 Tax=Phtheirospermum japonicum TaxID=374723 RepID=A0A830CBM5_9LAMI|nr:interactor of constitutive active rops 3 [Phtheirospermum japonicum]
MQTPKARNGSSGAPQKNSPVSQKTTTPEAASPEASQKISPRVVRQLKTGPRFLDHTASSANLATKAPKEKSPKVADHRVSPRSSPAAPEKKRPSRVPELETQISQLENDLKTVKDQLCSTEEQKKLAQRDANESNKQLLALSLKLEQSNSVQSDDSAALASALDEIKQLKAQLEVLAESDKNELDKVKENLSKTLTLVEDMKSQLSDCKESETRAHALVAETLTQLETAKKTVESLKSDGLKAAEAYNAVSSELDRSRARVDFLEELAGDQKMEVEQLRSALEAAEMRYNDERSRSEEEIRDALEMARKSKHEVEELRANLMDKETELQGISEENESLVKKLETTHSGQREIELEKTLENLRAGLMDKETENEKLRSEIEEITSKYNNNINGEVESARDGEREAISRVRWMEEELERSKRKAERAGEQVEAAQAGKAEMEAEMRRLKVQSEQWRKAAEAAAAMMSAGNNNNGGQVMERTGSMDSHYSSPRTGKVRSPYGEELLDDEDLMMKKKNAANMLRRFGVMWKKQQK